MGLAVLRDWRFPLVFGLVISVPGCADGNSAPTAKPVPPMQVHCVGRHQIDLPESFRIEHAGSSATFYFGHGADFETVEFQVVGEGLEAGEFAQLVGVRSDEIAAETNEKTAGPMLLAHEDLGDDTVLLRYHRNEISDRSHVHEVHRLVDGAHVFLRADSYQGVMAPVEARLKALASRVGAVPQSHEGGIGGFCIGPVAIEAGNDYEVATIRYRDARLRHRDVVVEVELGTFSRDDAEPRLVRRAEGNFLGLGFRPRALRKGAARLAGMSAEEWLGRERIEKRTEHVFAIESYPDAPGLASPTIQVTLGTGGTVPPRSVPSLPPYRRPAATAAGGGEPVTASLTDDEAVALWDAVTRSLQPR